MGTGSVKRDRHHFQKAKMEPVPFYGAATAALKSVLFLAFFMFSALLLIFSASDLFFCFAGFNYLL
jgi:hypothetical protein